MIFSIIFTRIKSLILFFLNRFRRALCCFRRRRRPSFEDEPLTYVGVVSNNQNGGPEEFENWNEWGEKSDFQHPTTIEEHIQQYRAQKNILANQQTEPEVDENFFDDMAPKITRQKKVYVNKNEASLDANNSLSLVPDFVNIGGELGEWDETSGWEAQTQDWDVEDALRESKRLERERKLWEQHQRRMERSARPLPLGAKLNS